MITTTSEAYNILSFFEKMKAEGRHAAIDFKDGELMLSCTRPSQDPAIWGLGAVPQTQSDDWVRLRQC